MVTNCHSVRVALAEPLCASRLCPTLHMYFLLYVLSLSVAHSYARPSPRRVQDLSRSPIVILTLAYVATEPGNALRIVALPLVPVPASAPVLALSVPHLYCPHCTSTHPRSLISSQCGAENARHHTAPGSGVQCSRLCLTFLYFRYSPTLCHGFFFS